MPVKVVAQVIKVTERLLDTDLDVLHLLLILSDQPIEQLVTELLVVLRIDWLNSNQLLLLLVRERFLGLLAVDGHDLIVAGRPEEALVVRPDTVLLCLLEFVESFSEARVLFGEVFKSGHFCFLHEHPEGGSHRHSEPQVILDHGAANERSDKLEALHPLRVCHCSVQSVAVTLCTSLVSAVGHFDEQWELISHEFLLNLTETKGGSIIFFLISWLQFGLVIWHDIETVVRVLHHSEFSISEQTNLIKLTKCGGMDEVRIVFDALVHEVIGFFAVVAELASNLRVTVVPVLLKCFLKEALLD